MWALKSKGDWVDMVFACLYIMGFLFEYLVLLCGVCAVIG